MQRPLTLLRFGMIPDGVDLDLAKTLGMIRGAGELTIAGLPHLPLERIIIRGACAAVAVV